MYANINWLSYNTSLPLLQVTDFGSDTVCSGDWLEWVQFQQQQQKQQQRRPQVELEGQEQDLESSSLHMDNEHQQRWCLFSFDASCHWCGNNELNYSREFWSRERASVSGTLPVLLMVPVIMMLILIVLLAWQSREHFRKLTWACLQHKKKWISQYILNIDSLRDLLLLRHSILTFVKHIPSTCLTRVIEYYTEWHYPVESTNQDERNVVTWWIFTLQIA